MSKRLPVDGIDPSAFCLQDRRSATELNGRATFFRRMDSGARRVCARCARGAAHTYAERKKEGARNPAASVGRGEIKSIFWRNENQIAVFQNIII